MTLTRSQIERLGVRLVRSDPPATEDLAALHELLLGYGDALEEAVTTVHSTLGITPSSRVKTTGTILEKLERYGGSWLKTIQDLAGMRIVSTFNRRDQDLLVALLIDLFREAMRPPKLVDRRKEPSYGYRAVHVIVFVRSLPVEIQVRTQLQHEWAELFEKVADKVGRGIRYGEPPNGSDRGEREMRSRLVQFAQMVAMMIDAYEVGETFDPTLPAVRKFRGSVDSALTDLGHILSEFSIAERAAN